MLNVRHTARSSGGVLSQSKLNMARMLFDETKAIGYVKPDEVNFPIGKTFFVMMLQFSKI